MNFPTRLITVLALLVGANTVSYAQVEKGD